MNCFRYHHGLLTHPLTKILLDIKWNEIVKKPTVAVAAVYLLLAVSLTIFAWSTNHLKEAQWKFDCPNDNRTIKFCRALTEEEKNFLPGGATTVCLEKNSCELNRVNLTMALNATSISEEKVTSKLL